MTVKSVQNFDFYIGIDLGGGKGKNTAVALLTAEKKGVSVRFVSRKNQNNEPFYDSQLLSYIHQQKGNAVLAIDAPLSLPTCLRCQRDPCLGISDCDDQVVKWFVNKGQALFDKKITDKHKSKHKPLITPYTQRACEVILHRKYGILPRETMGQGMGPLTSRAHYLRRKLSAHFTLNKNLIEVYPKATITTLLSRELALRYKRTASTWKVRAEILERLSDDLKFDIWREGCLQDDHCFDAVICAYTAFLWDRYAWDLPEEDRAIFEEDGWIYFPYPLQ